MKNVKTVLRRKEMPSSLKYVKRFSMCNCLTIPMPDTYTAHAMTVDFFLRKVRPGVKVVVDEADMRPADEARAFKIPKKIKTFLFSPFNEAFHEAYDVNGIRYTCIGRELGGIMEPLPRRPLEKFCEEMSKMRDKVMVMWGDRVLKVLVLYDSGMAGRHIRERLIRHDEAAVKTLGWPVVQVHRKPSDKNSKRRLWYHYSDGARNVVLKTIKKLEDDHVSGKT